MAVAGLFGLYKSVVALSLEDDATALADNVAVVVVFMVAEGSLWYCVGCLV